MLITYFLLFLFNLYYLLLILQEAHYHLKGFEVIIKRIFTKSINLLYLVPLLNIFIRGIIIDIITIITLIIYIIFKVKSKYIVKLKVTNRIIRLICLNIIIYFIISALVTNYNLPYELLIYLQVIIVFISFIVMQPIEIIINKYYYHKAKNKIKEINPLVIGITGSAGKTTCKHILNHLLSGKYITFMTPKSYNTAKGIARSINEEMNSATEVAIIEYGASHKGDIKKSLKIVKPKYSLITNISNQHLETFKSMDNLIKEKSLLMENSEIHFYNENLNYKLKEMECISFGMEKADYYVRNIKLFKDYSEFEFVGNDKVSKFETKLLGKNNIINICACLSICITMGLDVQYLQRRVKTLEAVSSRLEIIHRGDVTIINDSFNSNKNGFIEALNVLSMQEDKKVIITPGVVTGGKEMSKINEDIAYKIIEKKCECYLVSSIASSFIKNVFIKENYAYCEVKTFDEAFTSTINNKNIKSILIENDITDIYGR